MYTVLITGQHSCMYTHVTAWIEIEYSVMYFKCIRFSSCSTELASTKGGGHTAWMHEYLRCS